MITGYLVLKLVHVLLAIVAVGFNATYGVTLARASKASRETQKFALEDIRALDRVANWAYLGLLLTGGAMVTFGGFRWTMVWTSGSLVLLVAALGVAHGLYTPTLKKHIRALDEGGPESAEARRLAARGVRIGMGLLAVTLVIVGLMVLKPGL